MHVDLHKEETKVFITQNEVQLLLAGYPIASGRVTIKIADKDFIGTYKATPTGVELTKHNPNLELRFDSITRALKGVEIL
jgi:hypothetical protein